MTPDDAPTLHRALAHPAREQLLDVLRATPDGLGVEDLATRTGLHVNTLREHLGVLEQAGLVSSAPEPRDRPGRPRLVYRATERAAAADEHGYRMLAEVLTAHVAATASDPTAAGRDAGVAWGRRLAEQAPPSTDPGAAVSEVLRLLEGFGFAPQLEQRDVDHPVVHLHRCPFVEVAREHTDVVCTMHLGLLQGVLTGLGADVEATELLPFVASDRCVAHLRVRS